MSISTHVIRVSFVAVCLPPFKGTERRKQFLKNVAAVLVIKNTNVFG